MHGIENLKQRIVGGERVVGVSVRMNWDGPAIKEMVDSGNYDYVAVDAQHGPLDERMLVQFCQAANALDVPVQLRIKHASLAFLIGNMLDLGPSMIEVPQVNELDTVQMSSNAFYYPQRGKRSWGPAFSPGREAHVDRLEYADWWNSHGLLWMQLESIRAVTQAKDFGDAGASVVSWGPNDLAFDREANPYHPLETDDDCIEHVLAQLRDEDSTLCLRTYSPEQQDRYFEMGATMFMDESRLFEAPA